MARHRRWRRLHRRAVAEVIGAVLLVALTVIAGTILWTFRLDVPPSPPSVNFVIRSGGSNPVWGDPTDCQPLGTWNYSATKAQGSTWENAWLNQCDPPYTTGNFSLLNTSQVIISSTSRTSLPLDEIDFEFICYNSSATGGTTVLVAGSLASMMWYPGSTTTAASDAPTLGYCGSFDASNYGGGAYGTLYNRLGMFIPIAPNATALENGDTFLLYIHNGGWPVDFECVDPNLYGTCHSYDGVIYLPGASTPRGAVDYYGTTLDADDYHGAPPWCFTTPGACVIYLAYTGNPYTPLASIPVNMLAPPTM